MSISPNNDRMTIIIPKELKEEIKNLAKESNRSMGNYIVTIIQDHVDSKRK